MDAESQTREELLHEVRVLRARVAELEAATIEQQKVEAALRSAKEYAETLIQSSLDMIVAVGANRRITEFNPAAEKVFGYTRAEVVGQPVDMLYDEGSLGSELNVQIAATGRYIGEVRNKRKNGELFDVYLEAALVRDADGNPAGVMGISRDITDRKQAEEEQARLTTILEATPDLVAITALNGDILYLNRAGRRIIGVGEDEPVASIRNGYPYQPEWVRHRFRDILPTLLREGVWSGELATLSREGREIPLSQVILGHKGTDGVVKFFSTIARDISEQKRIEAALRESEEKYRDLVENISDIIYTLDTAGTLTYMSPVVKHLGGFTSEEITGRPFAEFIHPEDLPALLESFQQTLAGNITPSEFRVLRKAGDYIWVRSASRLIVQNGEVVGLRGVLTDITERKRAEDALRESEQRYRNLFDNASDAIASFTLDATVTSFNGGAERMLGWSRDEVVGHHASKVATPASIALAEDRTRRFLAGDKPKSTTFEAELIHKDGRLIPVEARTRAIRDRNGIPIGFQGAYRDISAKKALDKQRDDFLAMLAHDIKNPLTAILGYVDLLHQLFPTNSATPERDFLVRIRDNALTINSLIANYLDLARAEAGQLTLQKSTLPLSSFLKGIVEQYMGIAQRHHLTLTLELGENLPALKADRMALERVFTNLVRNALKVTPETGRITVTARQWQNENGHNGTTTGVTTESSSLEQQGVVVEVRDTGPGIAPDDIPLLFQKYRRTNASRNQEGTGLGLFIVKTMVEAHGGRVEVESQLGSGSCFRVILPVTD
ncbi:MAG: PAS domain S-box protein [Deltaproteobacteria bacterium]|nr:PAS domain S-box protein [Deltaproteobacteria bacterium]